MPVWPRVVWTAPDGETTFDFNDGVQTVLLSRPAGFGLPAMDHVSYGLPLRHGENYVRTLMGARLIRLETLFSGAGWNALKLLAAQFISAVNPLANGTGALGSLWFEAFEGDTRYAIDCLPVGPLEPRERRDVYRQHAMAFWAPDPRWRKASATQIVVVLAPFGLSIPMSIPATLTSSEATELLANAGHLPTPPVVSLQGACVRPKVTLVNTGATVEFLGELVEGDQLVIDMGRHSVLLNGANRVNSLSIGSELWEVPTGGGHVTVATSNGGVTATFSYYEQFLAVDL